MLFRVSSQISVHHSRKVASFMGWSISWSILRHWPEIFWSSSFTNILNIIFKHFIEFKFIIIAMEHGGPIYTKNHATLADGLAVPKGFLFYS